MQLARWYCNSKDFRGTAEYSEDCALGQDTKTLGLVRKSDSYTLFLNLALEREKARVTKRSILSTVACLFEPRGILCPNET